jgi:NAD(P)-dependent dehydrogenase (short-subunit alcohol dehydrogenase family)
MEKKKSRIWFITGISSGLGKALAEVVMQSGDFVVGTFRNAHQVEEFNRQYDGKGLALPLDVTQTADISQAFDTLRQRFGRLDVLVNNAGFGFAGAIEEASLAEVRDVFEANFFGTLQVTQAALPLLRQQRGGHILQISSQSGFKAVPGFGIYNASKFALEGFSEALAAEVAPLGIRLTIVEPGPFRTDFASRSFRLAARVIDDYRETAGAFRQRMKDISGKQEGDPYKAAQAIVAIVAEENPPLRLPLGKLAVATLTAKLESVQRDLDAYRHIAENAVYT